MDPITLAAIMGGAGLLKSELIDRPREESQRKLAAETIRWSPWTGIAPGAIQSADPFGAALQGATTGAVLGQNLNLTGGKDAATKDLAEAAMIQPETINLTAQPTLQEQLAKKGYYQTQGRMQSSPWQGMTQYALS